MAAIVVDKTPPAPQAMRRVVPKHHLLVRISHWATIPILLGLGTSGLSIYWASPIYQHPADAAGNTDSLPDWIYNHFSLGTGLLADALRLHWLFAYLFMLNGLVYLIGLGIGGGYRSLLPRRGDLRNALRMQIYYVGLPFAKIFRRKWTHPPVTTKYNSLQRAAYFSMPVAGTLSVLTGWAIHKPQQLGWLQGLFGGYDYARVWHFLLTWVFALFVIPHVILVFADGWDTFRSMVVGWSERVGDQTP